MSHYNRRAFLQGSFGSAIGLSLGALLTGLPPAFLASGKVFAADCTSRKFTILSMSGGGESISSVAPGSFDSAIFDHVTSADVYSKVLDDGRVITAADLANKMVFIPGTKPVYAARCFNALPPDLLDHTVFFHHRTNTLIHAEFGLVKNARGRLLGELGRGTEELPSAIAQENAACLGTIFTKPLVLSGNCSYKGEPLNTYSPTAIKNIVTKRTDAVLSSGSFGAARNLLIDSVYKDIQTSGTAAQKRFLDNFALSQQQAASIADALLDEVTAIDDDSIESQLKTAAIIVKLRLAPVVAVEHFFSGDSHHDDGTNEITGTLDMMQAYRSMHASAVTAGIENDFVYATLDVFGRTTAFSNGYGGRNHNANLSTGLIMGAHLKKSVVGGINQTQARGESVAFNSTTGATTNPDIAINDSLGCYFKSVMKATGIPDDRLDARVRDVKAVSSFIA